MASENKSRVLIVGAGAVGGFYGAALARVGTEVSLICRSDYDAVRDEGYRVESINGDFTFRPAQVFRDTAEAARFYGEHFPPHTSPQQESPELSSSAQPASSPDDLPLSQTHGPDYIVVCLKALPEIDIATIIAPVVAPESVIVLLQNGINSEPSVARAFPDNLLISGLAFVCLSRIAPGVISHLCHGSLTLGRYPDGASEHVAYLSRLFKEAEIPCSTSENITSDRWQKLIWNAPFNPISVLGGGATTVQMMAIPEIQALSRAVMEEVCTVAAAEGYPIPSDVVDKKMRSTERMKPYRTSMLVDFESGRLMEVDAILGRVVRIAEGHGLAVPRIKTFQALLLLQQAVQLDRRTEP